MSEISKKCNELEAKIHSISGLNDSYTYYKLLLLESHVNRIITQIEKNYDAT